MCNGSSKLGDSALLQVICESIACSESGKT